jgi:hypothetical protein
MQPGFMAKHQRALMKRDEDVGQPPSAVHTSFCRRRGRLRYILTTNTKLPSNK